MNNVNSLINIALDPTIQLDPAVNELAEILDLTDIQILRKFYVTGQDFPYDTQPYCFPVLYQEMRATNGLKIGTEALRKRLENMVKTGVLIKIDGSNPTAYNPASGKEVVIRAAIAKFFLIKGLHRIF